MRGTAPLTLTLPPFRGAVRRLVLANLFVFFVLALLSFAAPSLLRTVSSALALTPLLVLKGWIWQLLSYSFVNEGILGTAFGLLSFWYAGSMLEEARGSRWFVGLFYASSIGGALLTVLLASICLIPKMHAGPLALVPVSTTSGIYAPLFGLLVAFGVLYADAELLLLFLVRLKVKYLIAILVLIDLARVILVREPLSAALEICCGLCGYMYVRMASRQGVGFSVSERYYGLRNGYYRWKRRRAARKFAVYMKKQNREVHFDNEGRYISPEDERRDPRDRSWMN